MNFWLQTLIKHFMTLFEIVLFLQPRAFPNLYKVSFANL